MHIAHTLATRLRQTPVSGDLLAYDLGISRAAIWKHIQTLRSMGLAIMAHPGRGYALSAPPDWLEATTIRAAIPSTLTTELAHLDIAWSVPSTNTTLNLSPLPEYGCHVLLAEHQSGGRGRRGRRWICPLGGQLALSVLRGFKGGLARLAGLSLVAGIAVAESLHAAGFPDIRLKWPNDLVVPGPTPAHWHKLGGILVEGSGEHGDRARGLTGIGLNLRLAAPQPDIEQPWTDLAQLTTAPLPTRNILAATLLTHLLPALAEFDRDGLRPMLERYAALDILHGQPVVVHSTDGVGHGIAIGIAPDGALRVHLADGGEQHIHAADVSLRHASANTNC